jgi:hypothetical protein
MPLARQGLGCLARQMVLVMYPLPDGISVRRWDCCAQRIHMWIQPYDIVVGKPITMHVGAVDLFGICALVILGLAWRLTVLVLHSKSERSFALR